MFVTTLSIDVAGETSVQIFFVVAVLVGYPIHPVSQTLKAR